MKKKNAFTLIELLVVVAIIALLLSIVMPGLNMAKRKAATAACLSNAKQLSLAWYMYAEDNDDLICSSDPRNDQGWVRNPIDSAGNTMSATVTYPVVTDEDEIRGIEKGVLFPYYEAPDVLHCPADNIRKSKYDGTRVFRTYSIPSALNKSPGSTSNLQTKRMSGVAAPPGSRIMLVEEADGRNFPVGAWDFGAPGWGSVPEGQYHWWDPMAVNHGDSSVLGFCDGHAEVHKWRDPFTKQRIIDYQNNPSRKNYGLMDSPPENTVDVDFVGRAWPIQ